MSISAYFLLYNRTLQGISEASGAVTAEIAARGARTDGSLAHAAVTRSSPVELLSQPLFNPTGGYASYVVPAAFVLILQQTLFLGSATLGGVAFEQGGSLGRRQRTGVARHHRPGAGASLPRDARDRSLFDHSAARVRLFHPWDARRSASDGRAFRSFGELSRPSSSACGSNGGRLRWSCSSPSVFLCSSWSACHGRSRRFPTCSARRAASFRARRRSTGWCA